MKETRGILLPIGVVLLLLAVVIVFYIFEVREVVILSSDRASVDELIKRALRLTGLGGASIVFHYILPKK